MIRWVWAIVAACTIPVEIGSNLDAPRWVGELQDVDGDGLVGEEDCNDLDPNVGVTMPEVCDGRDNDCDGQEDEGAVCRVIEEFELRGNLDVLFVVDASPAASEIREGFLDELPAIVTALYRDDLNTQFALIGANGTGEAVPWGDSYGRPFLRSWQTTPAEAVAWMAQGLRGLPANLPPRALDVTRGAVEYAAAGHETFNRPRTRLLVVYVTPESDESNLGSSALAEMLDETEDANWAAHGILSVWGSDCTPKSEDGDASIELSQLLEFVRNHGMVFEPCSLDWSRLVTDLTGSFTERTSPQVFALGHRVQNGTLTVYLDGTPLPPSRFVALGRTLTFTEPFDSGGVLRLEYDLAP
ncbi:MAG: putative metal-binding motif-containing protein [Myxococcota bacterium]